MKQHRFARRVREIQVSAIKRMPLLARSVKDTVSLGQGIPSVRTPECIRRAVSSLLETDETIGKYTLQPGMPVLKEAIAGALVAKGAAAVDPDTEVFVSAGAMEALFAALASVVEEGDEVILFDPSYASHIEQVIFNGGRPVFVPLREAAKWDLDIESLRAAVTPRTRAIVVCNPVNPTGKIFSAAELAEIVLLAREHELYVIADETYDFLVYDDIPFTSLLSFPEIRGQLIACYSFSKQFAMTGWRVGYMYAPAVVVEQALKVHDAAVICAPAISQFAALEALRNTGAAEVLGIRDVLEKRRDVLCSRLDRLNALFRYEQPSGAYYVLARFLPESVDSEALAKRILFETGVITIPGGAFGPSGEGCIRFSFGGTEREIEAAFDRLESWQTDYFSAKEGR